MSESGARLYRAAPPMLARFDHPAARRSTADGLVLSLTVDGTTGVGECAPRSYVTGETTASVGETLLRVPMDRLFARLRSVPPEDLLERLREAPFEEVFAEVLSPAVAGGAPGRNNNLICLIETAVLDLIARRLDLPATDLVPDPIRTSSEPSMLPISQVLDLGTDVDTFLNERGPFHFVKVKASTDLEQDVRTITAIRERLGPEIPVMVDANMSWTSETAVPNALRLRDVGVDLLEEPLPPRSWKDLRVLRRETGVRVMLDESVLTLADARTAVDTEACDAVNVRVAKNGGLSASSRLISYARGTGLAFQIGVQVAEVGPLINAGRALAFRAPDALTVEAGQSDRFFADSDVIVSPRPLVDRRTNTLAPPPGPGFGMRLNASAERWASRSWYHDRWIPASSEVTS
ncbi:mandelate racemase/muconate lactonizing enzyme family protein [Nocardiopsis alba]|uniref:mandelate racemase/muconate lactonizing enzyme family protein n=1 Tax=Nocardiopsis alba TaxID=53437 RepID=UPI00034DECB9|nr:enolase C-terminal domain-like protein [Nocardiopsis alba]